MENYRNLSRNSRRVFWVVLALIVLVGLYAFFTSRIGQYIVIACCGGLILLAVIGLLSERGMRRPR